jgi:hypothetical protein
MKRLLSCSLACLWLASGPVGAVDQPPAASPAKAATKPAAKPATKRAAKTAPRTFMMEQRALDILKAASDRLAAARSMSFSAVTSHERPSRNGPPLLFTARSEVLMARPDKLRVITPGDGPASEFYYDGKTMIAYAPAENLVAIAENVPSTIDAALKEAYQGAGIYYAFTDLIVADPYKDLTDRLKEAFYIGQSRVVGGTTTDIVAVVNGDVFLQVWIGSEDKLPRLVRAVYLTDPLKLRHELALSDWTLDMPVPTDAFATEKTASATRISFAHPNQPAIVKSAAKAKPASQPAAK